MKQTKIALARAVLLAVAGVEEGSSKRKAFIETFNAQHKEIFGEDAKANLAPSYYQMLNYEVKGKEGGVYRHHKGKKGAAAEQAIEVVIPEGSKWMVVGETTEYFASRDAARSFKKANGGKLEKVA